jgi:hypothetical protein
MRSHRRTILDDGTADRLAAGELDPADAPPGYAGVAAVLRDARGHGPQPVDEELVAAMVRATAAGPRLVRKPTMRTNRRSAKLAGLAAAALFATAGTAAAATGNLPDPAQDAVADAADAVGIDLPEGTGNAENPTDADTHGEEVSEVARTTDATGREHGEVVSEVARAGHGPDDADDLEDEAGTDATDESTDDDTDDADDDASTEHGRPDDPGSQAPVETPNPGGIGTGTTASGGANANGAGHAADAATLGSGNADDHPTPEDHPTADDDPGSSRRPG